MRPACAWPRVLVPQVVRECTATAGATRHHHFAAVAGEHAHRRLVDLRRQHALHATREQRHPLAPLALGRDDLWPLDPARPVRRTARKPEQGAEPSTEERRQQRRPPCGEEREARQTRAGQHSAKQGANRTLDERSFPGALDVAARMVDQVHVVDPRRAGRHAGEAGEAAVDVAGDRGVGRRVLLQHVLDQVDAPARAVPLVAKDRVSRAGGEAETAMDAGAEHLVGLRQCRERQLALGELGLHRR